MAIYGYRGARYEIETPLDILEATIIAEIGTPEEREDAQALIDAWEGETQEVILPLIHSWNRS